jgi:hypothetical protein
MAEFQKCRKFEEVPEFKEQILSAKLEDIE